VIYTNYIVGFWVIYAYNIGLASAKFGGGGFLMQRGNDKLRIAKVVEIFNVKVILVNCYVLG
jgi:hypothetical protein